MSNQTNPMQELIDILADGIRKIWQRIKRTVKEIYESVFEAKRKKQGIRSEAWRNVRRQSLYKLQQHREPKHLPVMSRKPHRLVARSDC